MPPEAKQPRTYTVWLDLLPLEICSRIASMLPPWKLLKDNNRIVPDPFFDHDLDLLKLADVSNDQRRAVAASQQRVLRANRVNDFDHAEKLIRSWHQVLGNDIRQVCLSTEIGYRSSEAIRKVVSLPSIIKASIPHCRTLLSALHAGRSVKQLNVEFTTNCLGPFEDDPHLVDVIQSCAVEVVRLRCGVCIDRHSHIPCYAAYYLSFVSRLSRCESLRSLELQCLSQRLQALCESRLAFPNLQKLRLEHWIEEPLLENPEDMEAPFQLLVSSAVAEQLRSSPSVGIVNCGRVDYFAQILGERLTTIISQEVISNAAVRRLRRCPNLESVDVLLSCGADTDFPTNLRSLRSLSLSWTLESNTEEFYYSPQPEFLLGLVHRNKNLEELRLQNVYITYPLLEEILACVGNRLRSLQLPIAVGREAPPIQITLMLRLIMRHNPNIVNLNFGSGNLPDLDRCESGCSLHEPHGFFYPEYRADCEDCAPWKRVDVFLEVLVRRLPRISPASINKLRWSLGVFEQTKNCAMQ